MKKSIIILSALILGMSLLSSCKKDKEDDNNTPAASGTAVLVSLEHQWEGLAFEYNVEYSVNGVPLKFDEIRYYLSNFTAMDDEGSMDMLSPVILVDAGIGGTENLGNTSLSHLHMLSFNIGLDDVVNHQDPTIAAPPLNDPLMHWGWNPDQGYKFIKVEGEHDADGDGNFEAFSIHVATDAMLRSSSKMVHTNLSGNGIQLFMQISLEKWFESVDFTTLAGTHGGGATAAAVADAVDGSLAIDEESFAPVELSIMFHNTWNNEPFQYDQTYTINGVAVKFDEIRYYLSDFVRVDDNMGTKNHEKYLLIDAAQMSTHSFGEIPKGEHVHQFKFLVGLNNVVNHQDPTLAEAPLNDPLMHWGWNPDAGYKFIKIEGEHDADGDGTFEAFSIHVATDAMAREATVMVHQTISQNTTLHCYSAVNTWFNGVDFSTLAGTHGAGATTNAVMDAVDDSFSFE